MNELNQHAREVKNKTSNLYEQVKESASSAYHNVKPKSEELLNKVEHTAADLYESGKEKLKQADGYVEDSLTYLSDSVRKQPLVSVLVAAGIGYLLAKFK